MQFFVTRFFNFIFALVVFLPVSVFIVILSLATLAVNRFNPFFVSKRVGKNSKEFTCYKLQTLEPVGNNEIIINSSMNKLRLTKLGEIYRNHGWDELPQIVNIIKGDMNFIGPRPILENVYQDMNRRYPNEKDLINKWKIERLKYTPGLSGWHQINLNNHDIIKYDYEYFRDNSFIKNLNIFFVSFLILVFGKNLVFKEKIPVEEYVYYIGV